ncbi:hypothetical protein L484_011759 [Morus notabilis]|uniref:Uncharacterized protein n=1 Tax=Morus notabilis TaxID=981085 RepID=W9SB05_9ROSA|nr:hypothetical protein L484_011759 [Morus notabilis]
MGPKYDGKYLHNLINGLLGTTRLHETLTYISFVALGEVIKQVAQKNPNFKADQPVDCSRFVVISLGTGSNKTEQKYNAKLAATWGPLSWIYNNGSTPIIDAFSESSVDMINHHNSLFFHALGSTKKNLNNLVEVRKLKKPVSRINLATGLYEPIKNGVTNEEELKRFAKLLSDERKLRLSKAKTA